MEVTLSAQVTVVDKKCTKCTRDGKMRPMKPVSLTAGLFPHQCTTCKNLEVYDKVYPYIKINSEDFNEKDFLYNGQVRNR